MVQLLACQWAEHLITEDATIHQTEDQTNLKEVVKMTNTEEVDTFLSKVMHIWMKTMLLRNNMNVMTQVLKKGDGPYLPPSMSVVNTYTKVISGSKWIAVVVKNLTAILITITKSIKITQVVAANAVPPVELVPATLEMLDKAQGIQWTKMLVERRKEVLSQKLDLSSLEVWSEPNQVTTQALLTEYNDIFSLEPEELGCTDLAKHEIRVVDDEPFKEQFQRIPPPMLEEVWTHMKEILEVGAICLAKAHGITQSYCCRRKMDACTFALTFKSSMPEPRKTPVHLSRYRTPLKAWQEWDTFPAWIWRQVIGK